MPRKMSIKEAHEFLDSKPGWIALTTIGPDGYPHTVPLGYFRLGNDILMGVRGNTRKLRNIQDNPQGIPPVGERQVSAGHQGPDGPGHGNGPFQPRRNVALRTRGSETAGSAGTGPAHGAEERCRLHQGDASAIQVMGLLSRLVLPGK